jgi:uncharacterized protein (DUF983 family)
MDHDMNENTGLSGVVRRAQPLARLVWRAVRLRCPACGQGEIFRGWFSMHDACPACGRRHQRDAGFFLGSIYVNYGVTGILVTAIYFAMYFGDVLANEERLALLAVFVVAFPAWFFRYARALWIAVDEWLDPWPNEDETRTLNGKRRVVSAGTDRRTF